MSNGETQIRYLPFFQNPEIEESKRVNIVKYQPMGRTTTLATYTGAESRMYNINFKITLPNVIDFQANWKQSTFATKFLTKEEVIKLFLVPTGLHSSYKQNPYWARKGNAQDFDDDFDITQQESNAGKPSTQDFGGTGAEGRTVREKTIDIIMYWINMIRSSALNNSKDTTFGPPIIRVNHGILHQDVPCICLDYKINVDDGAGHDLRTLLPRVIQVTMNLMEYRAGNYKSYDITSKTDRDNVVGWESIIGGSNTIDPIRYDIGKIMR